MKAHFLSGRATLEKLGEQGEKTAWTVICIAASDAQLLQPGSRKAFRVKGRIDGVPVRGITLLPAGNGDFLLSLNHELRKKLGKNAGATVEYQLQADREEYRINADLTEALEGDAEATRYFESIPRSHRNYYSKWIEEAKTDETRAKRIARCMSAFSWGMSYSEMMREARASGAK